MKWAINKKLENKRALKGDPMDCNQLSEEQRQWEEQFWSWMCEGNESQEEGKGGIPDVDYAGGGYGYSNNNDKGKGKGSYSYSNYNNNGKGKGINQWQFNPARMMQFFSKAMSKGKGKGKGCFNCGKVGHQAHECRPFSDLYQ